MVYFEKAIIILWFVSWLMLMRVSLTHRFPKHFSDNTLLQEQYVTAVSVPLVIILNYGLALIHVMISSDHELTANLLLGLMKVDIVYTLISWPILAFWLRVHGKSARLNTLPTDDSR